MKKKILIKCLDYYRNNKTTDKQREILLDCMVTAVDGNHPDNWVEDVEECQGEQCSDDGSPIYPYTVEDLQFLRDEGIIS